MSLTEPDELKSAPEKPGIYRISHTDMGGIHCIGASEHSVQKRLKNICYGARKDEMPYTTPAAHAPCLWAIRQEVGPGLVVSWRCGISSDDIEDAKHAYLTVYQLVSGGEPLANFGGMYPGYTKSSQKDTAERGHKNKRAGDVAVQSNLPLKISDISNPTGSQWLGLDWSEREEYNQFGGDIRKSYPREPGVFKIWENGESKLSTVGVARSLEKAIPKSMPDSVEDPYTAHAKIRFDSRKQKEKVRSQLIGIHYIAMESSLLNSGQRLEEIIRSGEDEQTELKREFPSQADRIAKEISALSNASGGKIIIGASDSGNIVGVNNIQNVRERIQGSINSNLNIQPPIDISNERIDDQDILVVDVEKSQEKPIAYGSGKFYRRKGPDSRPMIGEDIISWLNDSIHLE
jgi:hypothetical protein